jgi:hypothetical protein
MTPKKAEFVGEVPVINRLEGHPAEGQTIGTARVEKMPSGDLMVHIDASGMTGEMLRRGFAMGSFSIAHKELSDIPVDTEEFPKVSLRAYVQSAALQGVIPTPTEE